MIFVAEHPFGAGGLTARKLRLGNGLQAILVRDPSAPLAAYQTWFRVGSRHEREGKTGIAHLFEHLMFNQTEHLAPGEFDRMLETVGADTNAATWLDWTYYRENVPREHLELVARLEADRMAHLVVHDPQIASEREVVANERRLRVDDDVEGFLGEELYRLAYDVHPYRWPTIGWMADIHAITTEDAREFYRTYYAPNNATLVIVGDFDAHAVEEMIERHYGALPASTIPEEAKIVEPSQKSARVAHFEKPVEAARLNVGWRGCGLAHEDHGAIEVAVDLLAGGQSSRLHRRLVIETEVASSVHLWAPEFRDPGLIELRVVLQRGHSWEEAWKIVLDELDRLQHHAPDGAELDKAKNRIEAHHFRSLRTQDGKAEALGHYETTTGDFRRLFAVADRVRAVAAETVRDAAARYFALANSSMVTVEPPKKKRSS